MAKYQVVEGFTVLDKQYPATIDGSEIDHLDSLLHRVALSWWQKNQLQKPQRQEIKNHGKVSPS
jgi:hypothetical protein